MQLFTIAFQRPVEFGIAATITTNVSYWLWYGFPLDYTLAALVTEAIGYFAAGLAIAWWLGRKSERLARASAAA